MRLLGLLLMLAGTCAWAEESAEPVEMLGGHPVFGAPMPRDGEVVSVADALADSDAYVGKAGKYSGTISEVCQNKGCWMVLSSEDAYLRVTFKDYDFFVPKNATGEALVFGILDEVEVEPQMAEHLASEGDERIADAGGTEYRIVARSVLIKGL